MDAADWHLRASVKRMVAYLWESVSRLAQRRWRLFFCAAVRDRAMMSQQGWYPGAVAAVEAMADGEISVNDSNRLWRNIMCYVNYLPKPERPRFILPARLLEIGFPGNKECWESPKLLQGVLKERRVDSSQEARVRAERELTERLLDIFGDPFYGWGDEDEDTHVAPATVWAFRFRRDWRTPHVRSVAEAAYRDRLPCGRLDPDTLAVLADALEDAGCHEENEGGQLLDHLRGIHGCPRCDGAGVVGLDSYFLGDRRKCPECDDGLLDPPGHWRGCWVVDLCRGPVAEGRAS